MFESDCRESDTGSFHCWSRRCVILICCVDQSKNCGCVGCRSPISFRLGKIEYRSCCSRFRDARRTSKSRLEALRTGVSERHIRLFSTHLSRKS